jgi:hypothetical protein
MKIEGLPEGYDIVRIGRPKKGELFMGASGMVAKSTGGEDAFCYLVLRKIEQPKQYRPFASAAEFKPHRDRWWRMAYPSIGNSHPSFRTPCNYSDRGYGGNSWEHCFERYVFDDGSPFGVEVSE